MHEAVDVLSAVALIVGLIGLWLCMIYAEPKPKVKRNHKSSDILGGNEL
jgi:uncharacterized membrane protein YuzA (DUF378 family)